MDKDQAQFVLESYQAGLTDPEDPQMVEALGAMAGDPELAAWFARMRAWDAEFTTALLDLPVPDELRAVLLSCIGNGQGDMPEAEDEFSTAMIGALAGIPTPDNLRARVLVAMDRSSHSRKTKRWQRLALPFAAAAGITLALLFEFRGTAKRPDPALSIDVVQTNFIRVYESPLFSLDERQPDPQALFRSLKAKGLPCPGCLPPGLANLRSIGCRELSIDQKRGAVICFDDEINGTVHLIIFRREDIGCPLPEETNPVFRKQGPWVTARWQKADHAYLLVGSSDENRMARLFKET